MDTRGRIQYHWTITIYVFHRIFLHVVQICAHWPHPACRNIAWPRSKETRQAFPTVLFDLKTAVILFWSRVPRRQSARKEGAESTARPWAVQRGDGLALGWSHGKRLDHPGVGAGVGVVPIFGHTHVAVLGRSHGKATFRRRQNGFVEAVLHHFGRDLARLCIFLH